MPADKRLALQVELFERAFARLDEALSMSETPIVRDAAIKRFEFTFEMAWKSMYRWLRFKGVDIPEEAFEVIPRAFNAGLIDDDASWTKIRRARKMTANIYDEKKAIEVAAGVRFDAALRFSELLDRLRKELADAQGAAGPVNEPDSNFGLDAAIARDLREFFERREGVERVWIYGSRARGEEHARSDVDLAVDAPGLDRSRFAALERALDELMFVRKVELVHWQGIADERFRREIEAEKKVFWEPRGRKSEAA